MMLKNEVEANSGNLCRLPVYYLVIFNDFVAFDRICHRCLESVKMIVTTRSWIRTVQAVEIRSQSMDRGFTQNFGKSNFTIGPFDFFYVNIPRGFRMVSEFFFVKSQHHNLTESNNPIIFRQIT